MSPADSVFPADPADPPAKAPLIGAHVDPVDPLVSAKSRDAQIVQFFLADPQGWKAPEPHPATAELLASDIERYVHAPYVVNVATPNNRIRIPGRKILAQHAAGAAAVGAKGLIVHGGHVGKGNDVADGISNWRKALAFLAEQPGEKARILIENTAGGDSACARKFDTLAALWDAVGEFGVGFCLDTCHAHAGGEELGTVVERVLAITGRIDLVHANNSKDAFDSGRDRHENLAKGVIEPDVLIDVIKLANAPVVVETPGGADGQGADIAYLRERLAA